MAEGGAVGIPALPRNHSGTGIETGRTTRFPIRILQQERANLTRFANYGTELAENFSIRIKQATAHEAIPVVLAFRKRLAVGVVKKESAGQSVSEELSRSGQGAVGTEAFEDSALFTVSEMGLQTGFSIRVKLPDETI